MELIKEILGDSSVKVDKQRIKYVQEYFQDEIEKEKAIHMISNIFYLTIMKVIVLNSRIMMSFSLVASILEIY